jgi:hypothetical protein
MSDHDSYSDSFEAYRLPVFRSRRIISRDLPRGIAWLDRGALPWGFPQIPPALMWNRKR